MARKVNVHEAKTQFSALIDRVLAGEEIIIARAGKPVARLTALTQTSAEARVPGSRAGKMKMSRDFDAPLPDDLFADDGA